ncbi:MAG: hypothetical protein A3G93_03930 [Nitrospinae bacterium RIFCSPLOWO2_12_FULL_45_22]|nr:MAG: hypothetical protein A3G93_03930 [Nitrospinae bacterium RIFCSPLOWO2_12_FULL_45_22]
MANQNMGYDSSWDEDNEELFDKKYAEWEKRKWEAWLKKKLTFPFMVTRKEDEDDAYFTHVAKHKPFRLGHTMNAVEIAGEDSHYGVIIKVSEEKKVGYVPLCDVEVTPKSDPNYWSVREYVVWFANR